MEHYFAKDGSFGSAEDLVVLHTDNWTEDDFNTVEDTHDSDRIEVAQKIARSKHSNVRLRGL